MASNSATEEKRIKSKAFKAKKEDWPDAPEGAWKSSILSKKSRISELKDGNDLEGFRVSLVHRLDKAIDKENETHQGSEISLDLRFYDCENYPNRRKADNMTKGRLRQLCEATDLDYDDVYPDEISESTLKAMIAKFEGIKGLDIWTIHRKWEMNGEERTQTEIRYTEPGAKVSSEEEEEEENEDRPAARGRKGRR